MLEALGGSSIQWVLSILSARLGRSSGRRDYLQLRMLGRHRGWGSIPVQVVTDYPIFGVVFHYSKLFFVKSLCHTRIVYIQFDLLMARLTGRKEPNLLLFRILDAVDDLEIFWIMLKLCVVWCYVCCSFSCCCVVSVVICVAVFFSFLFCISALFVGYFAVTNVTLSALLVGFFSALFVGFFFPLCRVM